MKPTASSDEKQTSRKQIIGGILLKSGLITEDQLKQALKRQAQVGGHLGSILIQMGFLEVEDLLKILAKQHRVPAVNLFKLNIRPEVIASLPLSKIEAHHIGEMRDKDSFQIALQAASTGHLVMTTAHGDNTTSIIERVVNSFEPHQQNLIRQMLASCLLLSASQRLVTRRTSKRRIMALEKLVATNRVRNLIRGQKTHQIRSQMQAGTEDFQSLDLALGALVNGGQVDLDQAISHAEDGSFIRGLVAGGTHRKTYNLI